MKLVTSPGSRWVREKPLYTQAEKDVYEIRTNQSYWRAPGRSYIERELKKRGYKRLPNVSRILKALRARGLL